VKVLKSFDCSQEGNDCYSQESYHLVRIFGEKRVLRTMKVDGYRDMPLEVTIVDEEDVPAEARRTLFNLPPTEDHEWQDKEKDAHTEHCCARCGCKYMDEDCTVTNWRRKQSFECGTMELCYGFEWD
jgi:hypothetical protein